MENETNGAAKNENALDGRVLEAVRAGNKKLVDILRVIGVGDGHLGGSANGIGRRRQVDRALQRLRKAGKIRYVNQKDGWAASPWEGP